MLVPDALREAAYALGTPKWKVIVTITLQAARAGVVTGVLLARRPHRGRDRAAAVHRAVQPVLDHRPGAADGQPAGHDLQVRDEPLRELAAAGLGRRVPDHPGVLGLNILARVFRATGTDFGASHGRARLDPPVTEKPKLSVRDLNFYYGKLPRAEEHQPRHPEKKVTAFIGPRAAASRRCCAPSTGCSSSIPSSAPKARSCSTARTS